MPDNCISGNFWNSDSTFQTPPTFEVGSAWASGGDGGGRDSVNSDDPDDQSSGKKKKVSKKKATKKKATKKKAPRKKKAKISIANDYPQSRYRDILDFQNWISTHAKKDNLRWIATNEKQLKKFVLEYEKFKNKYHLLKALEVNKIFTQLKNTPNKNKTKNSPHTPRECCTRSMSMTIYAMQRQI